MTTRERMTQEMWDAVFAALSLGIDCLQDNLEAQDLNDTQTATQHGTTDEARQYELANRAFRILWNRHGK